MAKTQAYKMPGFIDLNKNYIATLKHYMPDITLDYPKPTASQTLKAVKAILKLDNSQTKDYLTRILDSLVL